MKLTVYRKYQNKERTFTKFTFYEVLENNLFSFFFFLNKGQFYKE